jgi:group II intron reverse transcriptase/maturase
MQSAETVLGVLRERGRRGLPCDELYRQMFNPQLYLMAYGRIYSNQGAMTPGADGGTADGMSMRLIEDVIDAMRHERYRFAPVKRIRIPKKRGGIRPLGLPSWTDKLVAEVMRLLLEAYYEPRFSARSHGFRLGRGCHTALSEVSETWHGITWFIEADLSDCFDSLDHQVLLEILGEKICDNRFLQLVRNMLKAGYLDDWVWGATYSGVPQGGVVSPLLSNIYLHKLDSYVEEILIPQWTRADRRRGNPAYLTLQRKAWRAGAQGDLDTARVLRAEARRMPSVDPDDSGFRRLRYIRYADDFLLGFSGPKREAEQIKASLDAFLRENLALEFNQDKTLVTHARTSAAVFLGYQISTWHPPARNPSPKARRASGGIRLGVPRKVVTEACKPYRRRGKPAHDPGLMHNDDYAIVATYGSRYRGLVQYYLLAVDVWRFSQLEWNMQTSMLRTLAGKHKTRLKKMWLRYRTTVSTPHGPRACIQVTVPREGRQPLVARFGGIPLKRQKRQLIDDHVTGPGRPRRKEITMRLRRRRCELCGQRRSVEVHQIARLAELTRTGDPQPDWACQMAKRRRKTLVVCPPCHHSIHHPADNT